MEEQWLLSVRESVSLTGLGILLFPASEATQLSNFALHTALQLRLRQPNGLEERSIATVEEVSRPSSTAEPGLTERVLLLTQENTAMPPSGTEVWWTGEEAPWW
ncbi:hypothetical protein [Hymenobacter wooponensis]|uniref:Uncharacterized protein n=1 Tax=Hymenobacter wooponensis TaxID=1525360 RepID=A0A4Z0MV75_9BACT|nr:hypothetical protein [Hymenobacter wooponensis]TGD83137.1 hypothetical protein EU557_04985 [Hymenobacter wooponensis]